MRRGFGTNFIVTLQEKVIEAIRTWGYSMYVDYRATSISGRTVAGMTVKDR